MISALAMDHSLPAQKTSGYSSFRTVYAKCRNSPVKPSGILPFDDEDTTVHSSSFVSGKSGIRLSRLYFFNVCARIYRNAIFSQSLN